MLDASEIEEEIYRPRWIYNYLLFGIYSMSISPLIARYVKFNEKSYFVAISGILIYVAEHFAFKYKLKMIRLRSESKRQDSEIHTGKYLPVPHINPFLWFAVGMRMVFRMGILMLSLFAFGDNFQTWIEKGIIGFLFLGIVTIEILLLAHIYSANVLLQDYPVGLREEKEEKTEDEQWRKENLKKEESISDYRKEMLTDIVLQIYSFMLFTAIWEYINDFGIEMIHKFSKANETAGEAGISLCIMLGAMLGIGLLPIRLAYWIEDSVEAISKKEKWKIVGSFVIATVLTISPSIKEFVQVYFNK
jgi:hypothetical protein